MNVLPQFSAGYRADVDGLRALAVLAVIFYHAGVPGFHGGYVGVDVFFVISGFLITKLLVSPRDTTPGLHFGNFYLRRARRILPALFFMLIVVTAVGWFWMLPPDLVQQGRYLTFNTLMLGNLAGYFDFGYFAEGAPQRPLLHLWSIGVEEQFYLFYPLLLWCLLRWLPARVKPVLAALALLSFGLAVYGSYARPVANFYLGPTRAWELLFGALLALGAIPRVTARAVRDLLGIAALLVLGVAVVFYDRFTPYPGAYTLPVCLATLALLATEDGAANRLLALRPLVFIGLISYSLYLWHAPVLSLLEYTAVLPPSITERLLAGVAIFLLAVASWVFVEKPLRSGRVVGSNRRFTALVLFTGVALLCVGIWLWRSEGFPQRFPAEVQRLTSRDNGYDMDSLGCLNTSAAQVSAGRMCRYGPPDSDRVAMIWGDSHALALVHAWRALAERESITLYFAGRSSCRALLPEKPDAALTFSAECSEFNQAMERAVQVLRPDVVVLNSFWMYSGSRVVFADDPEAQGRGAAFGAALANTSAQLARSGAHVCVVQDAPLMPNRVPHALSMAIIRGADASSFRLSRADAEAQQRDIDGAIEALAHRGVLTSVNTRALLCAGEYCEMQRNGWPLFFDSNHVSRRGAELLTDTLAACFHGFGSERGVR